MRDRDWILPSIAVTMLAGLIAIVLIPDYTGVFPAVAVVPFWMLAAAMLVSIYAFVAMIAAGVASPFAHIGMFARSRRRECAFFIFSIFLAGLNMTTFMWTKPLLNYLVPFWADPLLAGLDNAMFLGHDPWVFLTGLNSTPMAIFYHRGWFVMMLLVLIFVLASPPSAEKSATMLTYFLLWSVIGPVIHILLPAAGPIFFADLGYGDRFAGLESVSETKEVATYLWMVYAGEGFGPGSGISAMPSLHIATTAWMIIATRIFARRLLLPMALAGFLIFLLSVALGWHYAADGIVGAIAAGACYHILYAVYARRSGRRLQPTRTPLDSPVG